MEGRVKNSVHARSVTEQLAKLAEKAGINLQHITDGLGVQRLYSDEAGQMARIDIGPSDLLKDQLSGRLHRKEKTLADFGDAELVMEMIRRGYAAMKLPESGGPPEALR